MSRFFRIVNPLIFTNGMSTLKATKAANIPPPRGKLQDVTSLFKEARCGLDPVASKIQSWEALFTADRFSLKELGLTPKIRRKVLAIAYKYRSGIDPASVQKHKSIPKKKKK